jgi:hypothetical protein
MRDKTLVSAKATNATVHPPMITSACLLMQQGKVNEVNLAEVIPKFSLPVFMQVKRPVAKVAPVTANKIPGCVCRV